MLFPLTNGRGRHRRRDPSHSTTDAAHYAPRGGAKPQDVRFSAVWGAEESFSAWTPERRSARSPPFFAVAHSSAAAARRCHGDLMQAVGREAPGDVCDARSSSLAASQFLPILEESRSPSADARALAPFKGNRRSGGSARARELPPPPSHKPRGLGPGSLRGRAPHPPQS
uniref:Uncharacterized protein n=1 Tax=Rangifer tarandus platyrhynchus TaxID=3082113 RepID=A0ACB0EWH0_RANTA|nr:unnamed protein product [Rangifer tarandus platyrhynchus]